MSVLHLLVPERWDSPQAAAPWRWLLDSGESGELADPAQLPKAAEIRIILPAVQVLHALLDLPRRGRWQETLPYALEDRLLGEPESVHVAAGPAETDGRTPVVAVDRHRLQAILAHAGRLGLRPQAAYSEADLDRPAADEWLVIEASDGPILLRHEHPPVSLDQGEGVEPPRMLSALLMRGAGSAPTRLRLRCGVGIDATLRASHWSAALDLPVVAGTPWTARPAPRLPPGSVNLLQGRFAPLGRARSDQGWRTWQPVLLTLAAALLLWLGLLLVQTLQWQAEAQRLAAREAELLRAAFPETRTILDPVRQMQIGLAGLQARVGAGRGGPFGAQLARLAGSTDGLPVTLQHLAYREGQLELDWKASDPAALEQLRQRLLEPPRRITPGDLRLDNGHLHLVLREAQP